MGLGAKLNFAFLTVILVMVVSHCGAQIYVERNTALVKAHQQLHVASETLSKVILGIGHHNEAMADKLSSDSAFSQAFGARNHDALSNLARSFADKNALDGFVAVCDSSGNVVYSGDSPSRSGYKAPDAESVEALVQEGKVGLGPTVPTCTGTLCVVGSVPLRTSSNSPWTGLVRVCDPISGGFLSGMKQKLELEQGTHNIELLLFSLRDNQVAAVTPGLLNPPSSAFVNELRHEGPKALPTNKGQVLAYFEKDGRLWHLDRFVTASNEPVAWVFTSVPVPSVAHQITIVALPAVASAIVAWLIGLFFAFGIAGKFNRSMRFLLERARDLQAQKVHLPPIDGLSKDFQELAMAMESAVSSPRISVKSLQTQMGRHQEEMEEKQKLVEEANSKVDAINRQLSIQSKQLSEVSKQINSANAQSIVLQQRLASVLQVSTEGFLMLDAFGNVLSANPTFLNWCGCTESELAGRFCFDLIRKPGEPRENGNQMQPFAMRGGHPGELMNHFFPEGIIYNRYYQDKAVEVYTYLQPVMADEQNIQGYILVARDKTLHSEAARLRNEMVSMLQDAIRAPLAVAEQKWSTVLSSTKQGSTATLGNNLVELHLTYQQLLGVVDSLLMMHTGIVPASPVVREQISVTRLMADCLESVAQQARAHQIMLDYKTGSGLPTTAVDGQIVRDVITQLLEKMISITAPGGRVRVESMHKGNEIRVSIFSSGPALPQAEIEDMFAGFVQGKHAEDTYSQRLSMYLVRNNIERIGGKVWAESDRGTYIYFTLPVQ